MSALAEALVAAQRRALGALEKAYVAGLLEGDAVADLMEEMGCSDEVDRTRLLAALEICKMLGTAAPAETNGKPEVEPASQKQWDYIDKLCKEKNQERPDQALTKSEASEVIGQLQAGSYDPAKWRTPF